MVFVRWYKKRPLNPMMLYCGRDEPGHPSMLLHRVIGRRTEHDKKLHNYCGRRSSWRLPCLQRSTNAELTIYLIARPADSETRVDRRGRLATWTFRSFIIYDARYLCDWIYRTDGIALATSPPTPSSLDIFVTVGFTLINTSTGLLPNVAGLLLLKSSVTQSRSVSSCST